MPLGVPHFTRNCPMLDRRLRVSPRAWDCPSRHSTFKLDTKASVNVVIRVGGPQDKPTSETLELMRLWDDIEKSCIWEPFVKAAKARDYELLKGMTDVFLSCLMMSVCPRTFSLL